jgi:hypothetical protein
MVKNYNHNFKVGTNSQNELLLNLKTKCKYITMNELRQQILFPEGSCFLARIVKLFRCLEKFSKTESKLIVALIRILFE